MVPEVRDQVSGVRCQVSSVKDWGPVRTLLVLEEELEGLACGFEAFAGFVFSEQSLVDGALAGVVDAIGDAGKVGVDAGELEIVIDLVEQVAEGGSVAIAGPDEAGELGRKFLLECFFEDGAAESGAGREEAIEVAASRFVEVAVSFFRTGHDDDAGAQGGSALDGGLDELQQFENEGGAEQVILFGVEGDLDGLPCGGGGLGRSGLEAGERCEALAGVLNEPLAHFGGETTPVGDESGRVELAAATELVVDDVGKDAAELLEAASAGQLGDGLAEVAARGIETPLVEELLLELGDVDGHGLQSSTTE